MISKVKTGGDFRGCISYCMSKKDAKVLKTENCYGGRRELIRQFTEVRVLNPKLSKPVLHISLSFSKKDKVNDLLMTNVVNDYCDKMGVAGHQMVAVKHVDTEHPHVHLIVNRINPETKKTLSDSNNYQKSAEICRQLEAQYNLEMVEMPNRFKKNKSLSTDTRKKHVKGIIHTTLKSTSNFPDFTSELIRNGIRVEKGRGIAFIDDKNVRIKGSEIRFSLKKIQSKFEHTMELKIEQALKPKISKGYRL